jgi:hypothetical protein
VHVRLRRSLLTAAALVAGLAVLIIIGLRLNDWGMQVATPKASPTASIAIRSPSPTASAAVTPTQAASASPTGAQIYNDDFGFLVRGTAGTGMRTESGTGVIERTFSQQTFAVSPDARTIVYWMPAVGPFQGDELRLFGVVSNSAEKTLVTLAAMQRGGGVVWSSDGLALVYSTEPLQDEYGNTHGDTATLNIYELSAGDRALQGRVIDTQTNTGLVYRPIAWDRSTNLVAAGVAGENGLMAFYVTVRVNPDNSLNAQRVDTTGGSMTIGSVHASSDAKLVLGIETSGKVDFWPLADVAARKAAAGTGQKGALWQPGYHRIGFLNASDGFVLFGADDGAASTPFTGVRAGANLATFRADGTAILLFFISGPTTFSQADYALYRLSDGANVTFASGLIVASVRLR